MSSAEAAGQVGGGPADSMLNLQERRRALLIELGRCAHLRRLLRARLDLTVAEAVQVAALHGFTLPGVDEPPSALDVLGLTLTAGGSPERAELDLVATLLGLDSAQRRLRAYTSALEREVEVVTSLFVQALAAGPSACLAGPPP